MVITGSETGHQGKRLKWGYPEYHPALVDASWTSCLISSGTVYFPTSGSTMWKQDTTIPVPRYQSEDVASTVTDPALNSKAMKRYYLHGDVTEHDPGLVYCKRHDAFVPVEHFDSGHAPTARVWNGRTLPIYTDAKRYEWERKQFYMATSRNHPIYKLYQRPPDAPNIFA